MFSLAIYFWLAFKVYRITRAPSQEIDITITGLIPSKPSASTKEASGTTVLIYFGEVGDSVESDNVVARGYADEAGEFRATVSRSKVGDNIVCRYRHAAYLPVDVQLLVMPYGVFHAARMELDGIYSGSIRGADVGDLNIYTAASTKNADTYRKAAFERLRSTGVQLSQIPFLYWLRYYILGIIAFAVDYYILGAQFDKCIDSVVDALYFSSVTVTTLGYGDIVPDSPFTKLLTGLQALSGVVLVGLFLNSLFSNRSS